MLDFSVQLFLEIYLKVLHHLLNNFLNFGDVGGSNLFPGIHDGDFPIQRVENDGFANLLSHPGLNFALQSLAFFDHRIITLCDLFVNTFFQPFALGINFLQRLVTALLNLGNPGIDLISQFPLGNTNFIIQSFQGLLPGIFVHIGHDVLGKVQHAIKIPAGNIQHQSQIGGNAPSVPDVGHRGGQINMPHALTPDSRARHLNAALVTNNSLITGILVFSTITLIITGWAKNGLAEQTVLFRT